MNGRVNEDVSSRIYSQDRNLHGRGHENCEQLMTENFLSFTSKKEDIFLSTFIPSPVTMRRIHFLNLNSIYISALK